MRKFAVAAAVALAAIAAPAHAEGEARFELRGGLIWAFDETEATLGAAAGYDFDLSETLFAGAELSADKVIVEGSDVAFGTTARLGTKIGDIGKLFAAAGYTFGLDDDAGDAFHAGAGYHHKLDEGFYVGTEYRHYFDDLVDADAVNIVFGSTF